LQFKMFRRKNVVYVQYVFEGDELKFFGIPHAASATISYKIVYDSEEYAKKYPPTQRPSASLPICASIHAGNATSNI
jgi:hypothetical protein